MTQSLSDLIEQFCDFQDGYQATEHFHFACAARRTSNDLRGPAGSTPAAQPGRSPQ